MISDEKGTHQAHRDLIAAFFRERPNQIVTWQQLETLVGRNYQQRVSDARRELRLSIENVPQYSEAGRRLTGHYRFRPHALGREADTLISYPDADIGPLFDNPGAYRS